MPALQATCNVFNAFDEVKMAEIKQHLRSQSQIGLCQAQEHQERMMNNEKRRKPHIGITLHRMNHEISRSSSTSRFGTTDGTESEHFAFQDIVPSIFLKPIE